MLVNLRTNRIYRLNRTAARLWELLEQGKDAAGIREAMLEEFDVEPAALDAEIAATLHHLEAGEMLGVRASA